MILKGVSEIEKLITAMDVAKHAGVSQSSVSRVYFEGATVSAKTREKVLAAAKELGYRPNELARSLITNRTKIIGIVMKGIQNPFYPQVLKQFTTTFKSLGYSVMFVYTNNDEIQKEDIDTLFNYNVAGVIITDASLSLSAIEDFKKYKIPLVLFNRKIAGNDCYSVCCNNLDASKAIANFLIEKGSSNMVYIAGNQNTSTSKEREQGFTEILKKNNIPMKKYISDYTYEGGAEIALQLLKENNIPDAIFVANDIMALGVLDGLRESSISIPTDTKVIGFDNIEMASWSTYSLTTWGQPIEEMVNQTVTYLVSEIEEYTGFSDSLEINGELVERKTT